MFLLKNLAQEEEMKVGYTLNVLEFREDQTDSKHRGEGQDQLGFGMKVELEKEKEKKQGE